MIIESTYGDREREPVPTDYEARIAEIIDETLAKGGNVVVPSFAVGRTQELLYMIRRIKEKHLTKQDFPVWLDSPLAIEATNIYGKALRVYYDDETRALIDRGINPISFPNLRISVSGDESRLINTDPTPKVIISASGMCEAGRIRHHLKYNLWRPESTVLFVGYQVEGTLGRRLLDGADYVNLFGEEIRVRSRVVNLTLAFPDIPTGICFLTGLAQFRKNRHTFMSTTVPTGSATALQRRFAISSGLMPRRLTAAIPLTSQPVHVLPREAVQKSSAKKPTDSAPIPLSGRVCMPPECALWV